MDEIVVKCRDGVEVAFTGDFKDSIFDSKIKHLGLPPLWDSKTISDEYDPYNNYSLNSFNYRSPEFSENVDFIMGGCSVTFGVGVQATGTWPHLIAQQLDASYVNISMPGASIEWICDSIYRYIETYGVPNKAILVLFPDLLRGQLALNDAVNISIESGMNDFYPQSYNKDFSKGVISHSSLVYNSPKNPAPRVVKKPYPIEYTVPREEPIRRSIKEIKNLERFAKNLNLKLVWSSWSEDLSDLANSLPEDYKFEYFMDLKSLREWKSHFTELLPTETDPEGIIDHKLNHSSETLDKYGCTDELQGKGECVCFSNCHFDLEDNYQKTFHLATDRFKNGKNHAHFGVHKLIHIAEDFIERVK